MTASLIHAFRQFMAPESGIARGNEVNPAADLSPPRPSGHEISGPRLTGSRTGPAQSFPSGLRSLPGGLHHLVPGLIRRRRLGPPLGIVSRIQPVQYESVRLQPGLESLLELPGLPGHPAGKIALFTDVPGQIVELDPRRIVVPDQLEVPGPNGRPGLPGHRSIVGIIPEEIPPLPIRSPRAGGAPGSFRPDPPPGGLPHPPSPPGSDRGRPPSPELRKRCRERCFRASERSRAPGCPPRRERSCPAEAAGCGSRWTSPRCPRRR